MSLATTRQVPRSHDVKREILLAQHFSLRQQIAEIREIASSPDQSRLAAAIASLRDEFEQHLADEEAFLVPCLARIDAWGPMRLEMLQTEHAHQRAVLAALTGKDAAKDPDALARRALALADDLLADMAAEEAGVLDPNALRDDMVLVAQAEE